MKTISDKDGVDHGDDDDDDDDDDDEGEAQSGLMVASVGPQGAAPRSARYGSRNSWEEQRPTAVLQVME